MIPSLDGTCWTTGTVCIRSPYLTYNARGAGNGLTICKQILSRERPVRSLRALTATFTDKLSIVIVETTICCDRCADLVQDIFKCLGERQGGIFMEAVLTEDLCFEVASRSPGPQAKGRDLPARCNFTGQRQQKRLCCRRPQIAPPANWECRHIGVVQACCPLLRIGVQSLTKPPETGSLPRVPSLARPAKPHEADLPIVPATAAIHQLVPTRTG